MEKKCLKQSEILQQIWSKCFCLRKPKNFEQMFIISETVFGVGPAGVHNLIMFLPNWQK